MTHILDVNDLTPEQIEQIYAMIETFRALNQHKNKLTQEYDPTPLFFESEILQPFDRGFLYGNRT